MTLFGGFASTVGWPLSAWLEAEFGWRGACLAWAGLHCCVGLPLNACLPRASRGRSDAGSPAPRRRGAERPRSRRASLLLAFVFAATWFTSTAMAAHLPRLLQAGGATLVAAVAVGALIGPAQVAGRLLEVRRAAAPASVPVGATGVADAPARRRGVRACRCSAAAAFALLHGVGNGILTIANGMLPLVIFGPQGYGQRQARLMMTSRLAQASSPWLFGLLLDRWGVGALWLSAALGLASLAALMALPKPLGSGDAAGPAPVARQEAASRLRCTHFHDPLRGRASLTRPALAFATVPSACRPAGGDRGASGNRIRNRHPPERKATMTSPGVLRIPSMKDRCSEAEWQARVDLAACYRLVDLYGMSDMMANHISVARAGRGGRLPDQPLRDDVRGDHRVLPDQGRPRRQHPVEARLRRRSTTASTRPAT